ncbi:hypothetical protein MFUL124B02_11415 [Myxococcus fulvus 124B02]|nr:hypothetical protein MFUL124B02_11415 [Myxococcus fulvus 124B02]
MRCWGWKARADWVESCWMLKDVQGPSRFGLPWGD